MPRVTRSSLSASNEKTVPGLTPALPSAPTPATTPAPTPATTPAPTPAKGKGSEGFKPRLSSVAESDEAVLNGQKVAVEENPTPTGDSPASTPIPTGDSPAPLPTGDSPAPTPTPTGDSPAPTPAKEKGSLSLVSEVDEANIRCFHQDTVNVMNDDKQHLLEQIQSLQTQVEAREETIHELRAELAAKEAIGERKLVLFEEPSPAQPSLSDLFQKLLEIDNNVAAIKESVVPGKNKGAKQEIPKETLARGIDRARLEKVTRSITFDRVQLDRTEPILPQGDVAFMWTDNGLTIFYKGNRDLTTAHCPFCPYERQLGLVGLKKHIQQKHEENLVVSICVDHGPNYYCPEMADAENLQ